MYTTLKLIHIGSAVLTVAGFTLRGLWSLSGSDWLQKRPVRVLPHLVDTVFLLSGIGLILVLHLDLMQQAWLLSKISALVLYIGLGMLALRRQLPLAVRAAAFAAALLTFAYIAGVALTKSAQSWWSLL